MASPWRDEASRVVSRTVGSDAHGATAMTEGSARLALGHGFGFEDLYLRDGLQRLDSVFLDVLNAEDPELRRRLDEARSQPDSLDARNEGDLLLALAPHVDAFVADLFGIREAVAALSAEQHRLSSLYACKRDFVQRRALRSVSPEAAAAVDARASRRALENAIGGTLDEMAFATAVLDWLQDPGANTGHIEHAEQYAAWASLTEEGRAAHADWVIFRLPERYDPERLIPLEVAGEGGHGPPKLELPAGRRRLRDGFDLTDEGADLRHALDEMHYCILCQHQGKDSCSHGMRDPRTSAVMVNPHGREMLGCPLEEKISEMHETKAAGLVIAPLAMIAVDNPMCAGTGHRICNDCMVACIFHRGQRQPVDIPQAETRILKDVLELPWGFEIYGLLTRWNPLNTRRPVPRPDSGYKVLVAGLGPAGYTLSHHLLNEGHAVVAVDGLKIEPLEPRISGIDEYGERCPFVPIEDFGRLAQRLSERACQGFGGVAEYGITVRWDKNFLMLVRLLLERRQSFSMVGGVRLGGTLTRDEAFAMGFDHVALCLGAGKPRAIAMDRRLARGVRQASDFLMGLQLTGAARADSVANLHVRLPVAVIGGGLTAIDTCTEALAYYPVQIEKFCARYERLCDELGVEAVRAGWTEEEEGTAQEWLDHARAIRDERAKAAAEDREPDLDRLLQAWGGARIVYRRRLQDSPSYRNNHEEVARAFEEGIGFIENHSPTAVEIDDYGHACGLRIAHSETGAETSIPARTVLVAAGTVPNTVLARESQGMMLDGTHFQALDESGSPVKPERRVKPEEAHVLMYLDDEDRGVSFFGDLHPSFAGNVVAAMASAKDGYPVIGRVLERRQPSPATRAGITGRLRQRLRATVHGVNRLAPNIVEVVVRAPAAAQAFRPGQFYRLQNYERFALRTSDTTLAMEGLALTGAWVDEDRGLLGMIVLEMGGSSNLCALLQPGEPVVVMGPTGSPTEIVDGETVMLVGGGLGNAVLFSIGKAMRGRGCKVLYFAGYKQPSDRYKVEEILDASDVVVWACDVQSDFRPERPQDRVFTGNIVQAMLAYASGELGATEIGLEDVDRVIAIGSDRMMHAVATARHGVLAPFLRTGHMAVGSINSPMQCMMKEICAQCLQRHVDPATGEESIVFSCFDQDQPLDRVDFGVLHDRLAQNSLQEKLTRLWIRRCLDQAGLERASLARA